MIKNDSKDMFLGNSIVSTISHIKNFAYYKFVQFTFPSYSLTLIDALDTLLVSGVQSFRIATDSYDPLVILCQV